MRVRVLTHSIYGVLEGAPQPHLSSALDLATRSRPSSDAAGGGTQRGDAVQDALGEAQSVLVLGGGSDIGKALCLRLIRGRCRTVILAGRPEDDMEPVAEALTKAGATTVEMVHWESTDFESHRKVIDDVFDRFGDIDLVYTPAGILGSQAAFEADPVFAAKAIEINFAGLVSSCLVVADRLKQQGHGAIVLMSTVAGVRARKDNFVYGSSKAGLDAFGQGLGDSLVGRACGSWWSGPDSCTRR